MITQFVSEQFPTEEYAVLQRRKERFEKLGLLSLSMFGFLGFALLFGNAAYYKIILFGPEIIFGAALAAMFIFGLLSVFFFNYPKIFMGVEKVNHRLPVASGPDLEAPETARLLEESRLEPIHSVTEDPTELLAVKKDGPAL
ncbi:MAG: hypothetical protein ABI539_09975 [Acidobacteriota bacterium]